ncbi:MAG: IclR family transcriptional regulator [Pelagimonas sp.]|jgi:IclR family acetate operon transcriptional repressor|nr:IclR family transcriptional regulator [Pelagimonas sp.]
MAKTEAGIVQSVDRALAILEQIANMRTGARVSELAQDLDLPVSTVHRLLTTLERRRFVQQDPQTDHWRVGQRAHSVGESYSLHDQLVLPARPLLRQLRDRTRETANLGVIQAEEAVTIAQVESREIMRAIAPPGGRVPVLNSGMGKAIVATWPDEAIANLVERQGLRPMTSTSLRSPNEVYREIARIRALGFAVDDEEYVVGMRCVAAVVRSAEGEAIAALSVSGLAARVTAESIPEIAAHVCEMAKALTDKIASTPEGPR